MSDDVKLVLDASGDGAPPQEVPLTPEEIAERDAIRVAAGKEQAATAFAVDEDAERLRIITERAATDPAYAALAELTLGTKGVQT